MNIEEKINKTTSKNELKKLYIEIKCNNNTNLINKFLTQLFSLNFFYEFINIFEKNINKTILKKNINKYIYSLLKIKKFEKIESFYEKHKNLELAQIDKRNLSLNTAIALRNLKKYDKAIQILKTNKKITTNDKIELAELYFLKKDYKKAEEIHLKLANRKNEEEKLHGLFNLGNIYLTTKDLKNLKKITEKCEKNIFKLTNKNYKITWLYYLGLFNEALNKNSKSINYYTLAANSKAISLIDIENKNNSKIKIERRQNQ